ncbi:DUF4244 domain-containing protein [Streptosporangium soli]
MHQWISKAPRLAGSLLIGARMGVVWVRAHYVRRIQLISRLGPDRGMSTAEYAVGTIAACGFAALLFKVVTSPEVRELLVGLINRALKVAG